jgi:hypothetical protein
MSDREGAGWSNASHDRNKKSTDNRSLRLKTPPCPEIGGTDKAGYEQTHAD